MAEESLRDLVVSLSLKTENYTRNINSVTKQIREAESTFKLMGAGIDGFESSTAGLSAKLDMLNRKMKLQKSVVDQYEKALAQASSKLTECYQRQTDYASRLDVAKQKQASLAQEVTRAKQAYEQMQNTLGENNAATQVAAAYVDKLEKEYKDSTEEVVKLSGQEDALQKATQNAADAVSTKQTQLNKAKAAYKELGAEIEKTAKALQSSKSIWTATGKAMQEFSTRCASAAQSLTSIGRVLTTTLTVPIATLGTAAVKASIDFESTFTSVRKTVDATEAEFERLEDASKRMSTQIAASTGTINEVMATGGQLGIQTENLEEFTRIMIDLGNCCEDLSADEAATTLAKFANVMDTNQALFSNIGSTIVDLGNNFATTEKPIAEMAMRLAGAGKQVGLTEAQVLGFAAALSSVGIQAQMGGSSLSKALIKMDVAVATGSEELTDFATVCGMADEEFANLFRSDPAAAFQRFITSLAQMDDEGISAIAVLDEIGISEIRLRDTILRSVNANELFDDALERANTAWEENTALTEEANKRYGTTASKLTNLKNKAVLFAQQLGDDLSPALQGVMGNIDEFIDKLLDMDASQRQQLIKTAAMVASIGPIALVAGKAAKGISSLTETIGKFATAVGKAGGGFKGFLSVISKSPAAWLAIAAATVVATDAFLDYISGTKKAQDALKGMMKTAEDWKNTAAETFYGESEGLKFFGMSPEDFSMQETSMEDWKNGLIQVWTDGQKETDDIVEEWNSSFKKMTDNTRAELQKLRDESEQGGYGGVVDQLNSDLAQLDSIDAEIEALLKKRQNGYFSEEDKVRIQELIDTREAIEVKYHLTPEDEAVDGFETIRQKLEAEVARARVRGESDADTSVYENAIVAAAQGLGAINAQIDEEYDKEYGLIQTIEDSTSRQAEMEKLNAKYASDRRQAAMEYVQLLQDVVPKVWDSPEIQDASDDVAILTQKLRDYHAATSEKKKSAILEDMEAISANIDEGALTEYVSMLSQIQSLIDSGLTKGEIEAMFPEINFTQALKQIAEIQGFLNDRHLELPGLTEMFGEALPEEVLKIAGDLDMTEVYARWEKFSENPGGITTEAVVDKYTESDGVQLTQPRVDAFINKYTEAPEGADKSSLTPDGLKAYVDTYAKNTNGVDTSALTPAHIKAIVDGYEELAAGTDVSQLKPSEITGYVTEYLQAHDVDMTGLTPDNIKATVVAYEEVSGRALTQNLTPEGVTAMVTQYAEAEGIDLSSLSEPQVEAIVTSFAEATNCDKDALQESVTAYIDEYDDSKAKKPYLNMTVGVYGYDELALQNFLRLNPVEVDAVVRLSEQYDDPKEVLDDIRTKVYNESGFEIPVTPEVTEQITADTLAVRSADGTMHVFVTPEITGSEEAIASARTLVNQVNEVGGQVQPLPILAKVQEASDSVDQYLASHDSIWDRLKAWITGKGSVEDLNNSLNLNFNAEDVAGLSAYVGEVVAAIQQGQAVSQEDVQNLQATLDLLNGLDTTGTGGNIKAGVAQGMTEAGWETDAETVASNLESALNAAFVIGSPAQRMVPIGDFVAQGVGQGAAEHDWSADAETMASGLESALATAIGSEGPSERMVPIGESVAAGVSQGVAEHDWTADAAVIAGSIESSLSAAFGAAGPAQSMVPIGDSVAQGVAQGITTHDWPADAATMAASVVTAVQTAMPPDILTAFGTIAMNGLASAMQRYSMYSTGSRVGSNVKAGVGAYLTGNSLYNIGVNAMSGLANGIYAGRSRVVTAAASVAQAAVRAAQQQLQINSPSRVFRDQVGVMAMRGFGEGIIKGSKQQMRIIQNAARVLANTARAAATPSGSSTSSTRTYNNSISSTVQVERMTIRDEQDIRALAEEIAAITRRTQRGRGMRMA